MYGTEAMIPVEVGEPTFRRKMFDLTLNEESLSVKLDLVNELRDKSKIWEAACKFRTTRRSRSFQKGDIVWRMRSDTRRNEGKFSSNWEWPFRIQEVAARGAYNLERLSGKIVSRTWNATHLKF